MHHHDYKIAVAVLALLLASSPAGATQAGNASFQVEVIRTNHGVPHIYAENMRALGYALGYLQLEDYGDRVPLGLMRNRGELARHEGRSALDSDFDNRPYYLRAVEAYQLLEADTRDVYEGFAAGVNRYIELHPREFPSWMQPDFTGYDVAASYVSRPDAGRVQRRVFRPSPNPLPEGEGLLEEGSSAWALGPSRTTSGAAILMRNPHLDWDAGYWEVHAIVPGRLDFYGDFRIGGPLGIIGGFNRNLGFATTNNGVNNTEVYALELDPTRPGHYRLDGASIPIRRELLTLSFRDGDEYGEETRERLSTHLGPVIHQDDARIYVLRTPEDGEFRGAEQFLRLIQASDLEQWKEAMRLRAHPGSNFVYADARGNIFYIWNAAIPVRPHTAGRGVPVPITRTEETWTRLHDLESLPQILNPAGGYVRNDNDGPWLTNLREPLDPADYPAYFEENELGLRSQHSLLLIDSDDRLSLEDVVRLKHSYRMLLADRVKNDLAAAVRRALDSGAIGRGFPDSRGLAEAVTLLERWDNTAAPESRGAVLFEEWWRLYTISMGGEDVEPFAIPWSPFHPTDTPRGLANLELAARVFPFAVREISARFGSWDVMWGEVHRVRRGRVNEPVGGCAGALGCFRVLNFQNDDDGRRSVSGGDAWTIAVEFTSPPRAYSVLAYGQSAKPDSPYHDSQAALFARGEMKSVAFTREDVERQAVRRYRPGTDGER